jgi:hypothetical protein
MTIRTLFAACLASAGVAAAADFFPLQPGNRWTYRGGFQESFEITVGDTPLVLADGTVYYRVTGYASSPLWVRRGADGVIYWLNEPFRREETLADFRGNSFATPVTEPCEQSGKAQAGLVPYDAAGYGIPSVEILYRIAGCADIGVDSELWVENLGLVRRVNTTFTGPREFRLVSARVGGISFHEQPGVVFRVSLPTSQFNRRDGGDPIETTVRLSLNADRTGPVRLRFLSSQRYDIAIKDDAGNTVYFWSADKLFAQVISEEDRSALDFTVPLSLALRDGRYRLEAWLTTDSRERIFAGAAPFAIVTAAR